MIFLYRCDRCFNTAAVRPDEHAQLPQPWPCVRCKEGRLKYVMTLKGEV